MIQNGKASEVLFSFQTFLDHSCGKMNRLQSAPRLRLPWEGSLDGLRRVRSGERVGGPAWARCFWVPKPRAFHFEHLNSLLSLFESLALAWISR